MNSEEERLQHCSGELDFNYLVGFTFAKLKRAKSTINGNGIITAQNITKGKPVCPLFGIPYRMSKAKIDYPKYSYQISDDIAIETSNEPGFFNHSCSPNVFINQDWMFEAIKDIKTGEEIVLDYATVDYFEYSFKCACKSASCRKIFNGLLSENKEFQTKRGKYFSPYLQQKFNLL